MGRHGGAATREGRTQGQRLPGQRRLRVGEEMRHILAELLARGEFRDPDLQNRTVTVTEVRVSPDLKNATAYVVPLGGEHATEIMAALKRAAPYARQLVGRAMQLRYTPLIGFELDATFDYASKIDQLLHRPDIQRDLGEPDAPATATSPTTE